MKRFIIITGLLALGLTSCKKFLEEKPESFLSSAQFFQTPNQLQTAVDGCYKGLERPYVSVFLGLPLSEYWSLESLTGLSTNPFGTGNDEASYQRLDEIDPLNSYLLEIFRGVYVPMANINNAIVNIEPSTVVDEATKNKYLGQLYFLRAWHYFHGVQLMGEIPLVTAPPASIKDEDVQVPKATIDKVYAQIVADLTKAEASGLPYQDVTGHVTMSAVKTLLAKVYLTMAGFPLNKGQEYYQKSYDKAKELINEPGSGLRLFPNYADLRNKANHNIGEHIFMVQRKKINANNELHFGMLPSPGKVDPPISVNTVFDTALLPTIPFYNTYKANDKRKAEKSFFYTYVPGEVMNYKFWDDDAAVTGSSGNNIWLLRYADLLLICTEAKAKVDGGSTSDATALKAYNDVHTRALPGEVAGSVTADEVLIERFHELAYEYISWYDMLRTRKTYDLAGNKIVDILGFKAITHNRAFEEADLLQPLPTAEVLSNPKLKEAAQ